MANDKIICGECTHFHAIKIPTGTGSTRETDQAHCLAKSIYAKNKVDHPVYPPGAKIEDLPFGRHKIVIVRRNQHHPHCDDYKIRKQQKGK